MSRGHRISLFFRFDHTSVQSESLVRCCKLKLEKMMELLTAELAPRHPRRFHSVCVFGEVLRHQHESELCFSESRTPDPFVSRV